MCLGIQGRPQATVSREKTSQPCEPSEPKNEVSWALVLLTGAVSTVHRPPPRPAQGNCSSARKQCKQHLPALGVGATQHPFHSALWLSVSLPTPLPTLTQQRS